MFATLRSVRLPKLSLGSRKLLEQNAPVALRLTGLDLDSAHPLRTLGSFGLFALGLLWLFSAGSTSIEVAIAICAIAMTLRFGFLFASFTPKGVAPRLAARFGAERGYLTYTLALDLTLFVQRVGFIALACATAREPSGLLGHALQMLGLLIVPAGLAVTVWAACLIGQDAYHYRDLFTGTRNVSLERGGPYAFCSNPMYMLGPLAGYGLAMLALSPIALLFAGVNQALLLLFNKHVEQPRLRRYDGIFLETQRRYELARSLLGFDPRPELTRLRQSDTAGQPEEHPVAPAAPSPEHGAEAALSAPAPMAPLTTLAAWFARPSRDIGRAVARLMQGGADGFCRSRAWLTQTGPVASRRSRAWLTQTRSDLTRRCIAWGRLLRRTHPRFAWALRWATRTPAR